MKDFQYIKSIISAVNCLNIDNSEFRDELIDHYCSRYETLSNTISTDLALQQTIKEIESNKIKSPKSNNMLYFQLSGAVLSTVLIALLYNSILKTEIPNLPPKNEIVALAASFEPPYGNPLHNIKISSNFGKVKHPITKILKMHNGIDLRAPYGEEVFSVQEGIVQKSGYDDKLGNYIEIKHDDNYSTRYHHLKSSTVKKGDKIIKNQKIGEVGSTGLSTGPHLHYEIIKNGEKVDPINYLRV